METSLVGTVSAPRGAAARCVVLVLFALILPISAQAHASPIDSNPGAGSNVASPSELSITFSERLEKGSSRIQITENSSVVLKGGVVDETNPRRLLLPIEEELGDGVYLVSWSVISADDGHFTKGTYAFAVGTSSVPVSSETTVIPLRSPADVFTLFIELAGNSLLWGVFVVYFFLIRRAEPMEYLLSRLFYAGALLAFAGGGANIALKVSELSRLQEIAVSEALSAYSATFAGGASFARLGVVVMLALVWSVTRGHIGKWFVGSLLVIFALLRGMVSHATANPFFPEISVLINTLHLIEKDSWFGVLLVIVAVMLSSHRAHVGAALRRLHSFLSWNLAALSLTATYIIWLHLKYEGNLATTWGDALIPLLMSALCLVAMRTYHSWYTRAAYFRRALPATLTLETVAAGAVVLFSAAIIITSPPQGGDPRIVTASDRGVSATLEYSLTADDELILALDSDAPVEPVVMANDILITVERESGRTFALSEGVLAGLERIEVIVPQDTEYDAHITLPLPDTLTIDESRSLDAFAYVLIVVALLGALFAVALLQTPQAGIETALPGAGVKASILLSALVGAAAVTVLSLQSVSILGNAFKRECLDDGNAWHTMQPTSAYKTTSARSQEGCMLMGGAYHVVDHRAYTYLRSLGDADVRLDTMPVRPTALVPTELTVTLRDEDGTGATLLEEHERLLHVIVISEDMDHFAHIHPDDLAPITEEDVRSGIFKLRYAFPASGKYIIAVDYLHGLVHESKRFVVDVDGSPEQGSQRLYADIARRDDYTVTMDHQFAFAGELSSLYFKVMQGDTPVYSLEPYLGAAMHIAFVKNDLSSMVHGHGEVHPPGTPPPSTLNHVHAAPPPRFGPDIEAHVVFPSAGTYTVFAEFSHEGEVIPVRFTTRVQ